MQKCATTCSYVVYASATLLYMYIHIPVYLRRRAAGWSSPGPCLQPRGPGARGYEKPIFYRTVPVLSKREFAARSVILERAII